MDPSALRQLLAVLREGGAMAASFDPTGALLSVTLGSVAPPSGDLVGSQPAVFRDDSDDLPPGAYDVVARAKREGR
jgi:hypothetical protein